MKTAQEKAEEARRNLPLLPDEVRCILVLLMEEARDSGPGPRSTAVFENTCTVIRRFLDPRCQAERDRLRREVEEAGR